MRENCDECGCPIDGQNCPACYPLAAASEKPLMRVLIVQDAYGCFEVFSDEPCEVICVSEHSPNDRLYRLTEAHTVGYERVENILRGDAVGHSGDIRHEAVANRIISFVDGKPHLRPTE